MPNASISPALAQSRHPQEVEKLIKSLGVASADQVRWSYALAVRVDDSHAVSRDKGINVFLRNPHRHLITLDAAAGRKRRSEPLDHAKLLAAPRENLPVELFDRAPRPIGVSAYLWQPNRPESPGWNEFIITRAVARADTMLLMGQADDGATRLVRVQGQRWKEVQASVACEVFGKTQASSVRAWVAHAKPLSDSGASELTTADLEKIVSSLPNRKLPVIPASPAELLAELGHAAPPLGEEPPALPPLNQGRVFDWGQQVDEAVIAPYAALLAAQSGVSSGGFFDVIRGLSDPVNHAIKEVAAGALERIALGEASDRAIDHALAQFAAKHELPAPAGQDPVAFLRQHLATSQPVAVLPVALPPRRG